MLAHILLAWDGSVQVARTVAQVLPLLRRRATLDVFTAGNRSTDQPGQDLLRDYLGCHGLNATFTRHDYASLRIGSLLLDTARQQGASMICMGAYRHARTKQMLIGGNTWHVYTHSPIAVLFGC